MDDQEAFARKYAFPFPLLADVDREIGMAYGAGESKTDGYAKRISYLIGPDGTVLEAHPSIDVKAYPAEQLASLQKIKK